MTVHAGIVGFRGYSGMELHKILSRHPRVETWLMEHREEEGSVEHRTTATPEAARQAAIQVVFLATPAEVSMELAADFVSSGIKVIDLSGAFRLRDVETFSKWYGEPHTQPALLADAVYGLPEFYRDRIPGAALLANPGCYPTAANLALRPLVHAGVIDLNCGVVCDAKSGASGAGRKPSLKTHFCEVTENFSAYSVFSHRHVPEVLQNSGLEEKDFSFTAQLIPTFRGILETIYFRALNLASADDLLGIYEAAYSGEAFVRLYKRSQLPDLAAVSHTNYCDIGFKYDAGTGRAVVVVAIDNLGKGAAGQAVQNMNLMFGFPEAEGLQ